MIQCAMGLNARVGSLFHFSWVSSTLWLIHYVQTYGWSCEYVIELDVVTADGEFKHCNEIENSDLYWAARGAGPGIY